MAYQSLYRRYRPRRFGELRGQEHVVRSLRGAVRDDRVGHAYLFSGPRGTGKTSTARILAKVLNCERPVEGEPCCACDSCLAVEAGTSYDVHELDAASNNGVDAMRDLIDKAALGTPGRTKVYILDEVHMLSKAAEAALLKTLEEPPAHVVFVLATTDPQRISPTIKSRTQHFEFHLLAPDVLADYVRQVVADAKLDVTDEAVEAVVRLGAGSARDTLSALDQVVAAGGIVEADDPIDDIVEALAGRDTARALTALAAATAAGRDARGVADRLIAQLRDGFLSLMAPELVPLPEAIAARVADQAHRLGAGGLVRAMEALGEILVEFRHAPDPRLLLDVVLVKLTNPAADASPAALLERIERLEATLAGTPGNSAPDAPPTAAVPGSRPVLGGARSRPPAAVAPTTPSVPGAPTTPSTPTTSAPSSTPAASARDASAGHGASGTGGPGSGGLPGVDELQQAWPERVLSRVKPLVRVMYSSGHLVGADDGAAVIALPNSHHRDRCEPHRPEVEAALAAHFGRPVPVRLTVQGGDAGADGHPDADVDDLVDAGPEAADDPIARVTAAFPGAQLLDDAGTDTVSRGASR